ncbi:MAG: BlaI/MecI/CopY family transcriptional regulator [Agathobacter sp.]|nr:BlaI/MecI/CopY family transcriptional regulator [Agathobacter sp.]MBQ2282876.1 BlaI/MecI/CopY family transcriptional regulator [Agathobacter sp.]
MSIEEIVVNNKPSNAERVIMKVIWDAPGEISMKQLEDELREKYHKTYARTTIVTFLQRLQGKGYIRQGKKGRYAYIVAVKSEKEFKESMLLEIMDFWFEGDLVKMFAFLIKQEMFTKEERARVREILDKMSDENKKMLPH